MYVLFISAIAITIILNLTVKAICHRIISKSKDAHHSVRIRLIYRCVRLSFIVLYTLVFIPEVCCILYIIPSYMHSPYLAMSVGFALFAIAFLPYLTMALPVSGMTLDKLKDEEFALFLRGFSSDCYETKMYDKLDDVRQRIHFSRKQIDVATLSFSEFDFAKAVKQFMPVYSVGMTKEVDSPEGTKRIYLNDEDWKDGVKFLIERAKVVLILVNPSDSCIWEIMLSKELATSKTIFFVDNPDQMDAIKNKLEYKQIPECIRNFTGKHTYHFMIDNECFSFVYTNNKAGFINAINVFLKYKEREAKKKEEEIKKQQENLVQPDYSRYMPH